MDKVNVEKDSVLDYEPINDVWEGHKFVYDINSRSLFVKWKTEDGKIEYRKGVKSENTIILLDTFEVVNLDKYDMNLFDKLYSRLWAEFVWKNERGISKVNKNMKAESLFTEMVNEKEESGCSIFYELFIKDGRCYYCSFEYGKNSRKEALSAAIFDYDDNFKEKFLEPFFMYQVGISDVDNILIDEINQDSKIANAFLINSKANIISIKGIEKEYIGALVNDVSKKSLRDR